MTAFLIISINRYRILDNELEETANKQDFNKINDNLGIHDNHDHESNDNPENNINNDNINNDNQSSENRININIISFKGTKTDKEIELQ